MRTVHQSAGLQLLGATPRRLHLPEALRLQAGCSGWLWVDGGAVWITRQGEGVDHVLSGAEALYLGRGDEVVAEPWRTGQAVGLRWARAADAQALVDLRRAEGAVTLRPARSSGVFSAGGATVSLGAGAVWRALAVGLRGLSGRLAAAARRADARASRAQGCMAAGDSRASSGALQ
jgi:hypothetical protein